MKKCGSCKNQGNADKCFLSESRANNDLACKKFKEGIPPHVLEWLEAGGTVYGQQPITKDW